MIFRINESKSPHGISQENVPEQCDKCVLTKNWFPLVLVALKIGCLYMFRRTHVQTCPDPNFLLFIHEKIYFYIFHLITLINIVYLIH